MLASLWRRLNASRDHRWAMSHFSEYVDEELPARQQRRLAAHERICPDCARVIRTLRAMLGSLPALAGPATRDPAVGERMAGEVRRQIDQD